MAKVFTFEDLANHKSRGSCWLLIHGKVYDVTSFMEEHPGGEEVLLAATGRDATDDFEDVGHSDEARALMPNMYIGDIDESTVPVTRKYNLPPRPVQSEQESGFGMKLLQYAVPLLILGLAFALQLYTKKED
ncbi:cytochrome b5-like [Carica papaya]|uniref:cytochrome b5-like n=1 Tax=Carica papaya TaxID=3649 RepID=UPI000B8CAF71|nr:cytochrome b5-like [Carica papaya]